MDASTADLVEVHQALHGYSGGHRQLQSSTKLPLPAERTLVILSDLSGPTLQTGFDSYITGYSLPETEYFALARTWYAPEMERPGCVWTHTLLIRHADLDVLPDLRVLLPLFRRPEMPVTRSGYGSPIAVPRYGGRLHAPIDPRGAASVLDALYSHAECPVLMPATSALEADALFPAVWTQQWPSLRRRFTFCTGSLANRELGGRPFDLQAVPERLVRQVRREVPDAVVVAEALTPLQVAASSDWLLEAVRDLNADAQTPFREFLAHAAAFDAGREMFASLAEAETLVSRLGGAADNLITLLGVLAARFPKPQDGKHLKRMLIGFASDGGLWRATIPEPIVLRTLATVQTGPSFDGEDLRVAERAARLWRDTPSDAADLLNTLPNLQLNNLGEAILRGLIDSIGQRELELVGAKIARIMATLVGWRPILATLPSVWSVPADQQREIADAIAAAESGRIRTEAVHAALTANADAAADRLAQQMGADFAPAVLEWVDRHPDRSARLDRGNRWTTLLAADATAVLDWLSQVQSIAFPTLAFATKVLNPHSASVRQLGADTWLRLIRAASGQLSGPSEVTFQSFCMAIALENGGKRSDELAAGAFDVIHRAAAQDQIGYDDWRSFQGSLPTLFWWQNWDRCERLRRGTISAFVKYDWPPATVLRCTSDPNTFAALLASARSVRDGEDLFHRAAQEVQANRVSVSGAFQALLRQLRHSP